MCVCVCVCVYVCVCVCVWMCVDGNIYILEFLLGIARCQIC